MEAWVGVGVAEPEVPSAEAAAAQVVLLEAGLVLVPPGLAEAPPVGVAAGLLANAFCELQVQEASKSRDFLRLFIAINCRSWRTATTGESRAF